MCVELIARPLNINKSRLHAGVQMDATSRTSRLLLTRQFNGVPSGTYNLVLSLPAPADSHESVESNISAFLQQFTHVPRGTSRANIQHACETQMMHVSGGTCASTLSLSLSVCLSLTGPWSPAAEECALVPPPMRSDVQGFSCISKVWCVRGARACIVCTCVHALCVCVVVTCDKIALKYGNMHG
jgi:hypothetical protein